jgi:hypothetical protein
LSASKSGAARWWIKLQIDVDHALAWRVVQELAHVLNYVSLDERLPTAFMPVSPPPYMNGGPKQFLSWVIEATRDDADPNEVLAFLQGRLPRPVTDLSEWSIDDLDEA